MKRRYLSSLIACALLFAFAGNAFAQMDPDDQRVSGSFYLMPKGGVTNYLGDRDISPFDFEDWRANEIPYTVGLEAGYQFTEGFSLSGAYVFGEYPSILFNDHGVVFDGFDFGHSPDGNLDGEDFDNEDPNGDEYAEQYSGDENYYTKRHTAQLIFRYLFTNDWTVAPFVETGLNGSVGYTNKQDEDEIAFGPIGGIGLDWAITKQFSIILEGIANMTVPDDAIDGVSNDCTGNLTDTSACNGEDRFSRFDVLSQLNLGLKYSFQSGFTPVEIMSLDCPDELEVGENATFTASINDNVATAPVSYDWDFDDGMMGNGLLASHSFDEPGTYTIDFTASNDGSTRTESCTVDVAEPPAEAQIVSLNASPRSFEVCEPTDVEFSTNVRGEDVDYDWDFGNGETSRDQEPQVTYTQPGTYTVTLRVSNDMGTDTRTLTVRARECEEGPPGFCDEVTELNPVFFDMNSSQLSSEARAALRENVEILEQCPNICARIEGFAAPGERDSDDLSEARAEAVADFYEDNGIDGDDMRPVGLGRVGGTTSKKQGTSQFRRADSIPVDCDDLGDMDEDDMGMDNDMDMDNDY